MTYVPGATAQPNAIPTPSIYRTYCPGCTVTIKMITAGRDSLLASDTSSNVLTHPQADYYCTEFEDSLRSTL